MLWGPILDKLSFARFNNDLFPNTLLNHYRLHALYILKIYCQVVGIDFALNHLIKLYYFVTADFVQANIRRFVL